MFISEVFMKSLCKFGYCVQWSDIKIFVCLLHAHLCHILVGLEIPYFIIKHCNKKEPFIICF